MAERTWVQSVRPGDLGAACTGGMGAFGSYGKTVKAGMLR